MSGHKMGNEGSEVLSTGQKILIGVRPCSPKVNKLNKGNKGDTVVPGVARL